MPSYYYCPSNAGPFPLQPLEIDLLLIMVKAGCAMDRLWMSERLGTDSWPVIKSLRKRGAVEQASRVPFRTFALTEGGRIAAAFALTKSRKYANGSP
jgi:hypothetical protein